MSAQADTLPQIIEIAELAYRLMNKYGLVEKGWTFDFATDKQTLGWCSHKTREIQFSIHYLHIDQREIRDTLLHEIAHALVGPHHGHDDTWKRVAFGIGARPERCAPVGVESSAGFNYIVSCPNCGWSYGRHRLTEKMFRLKCKTCNRKVEINGC